MNREFRALVLVGPTAVGKSRVAHEIARRTGASVLSADSMNVYRGMDIGTAKPDAEMRREVTYYGIDLVDPSEAFSVGQYYEYCGHLRITGKIRSDQLVVVGGSGLYIKALTHGLDPLPPGDPLLRQRADEIYAAGGVEALAAELERIDPGALALVHDIRNPRRLVRALELAWRGSPAGMRWRHHKAGPILGLKCPRQLLYKKIDERINQMLDNGLVDEVRRLREKYRSLSVTARHAIGYGEISDYLDGRISLEAALERMRRRTRRLVKRQMTWFRHQENVIWLEITPEQEPQETARRLLEVVERNGKTVLAI